MADVLARSGLAVTHLCDTKPEEMQEDPNYVGKGVFNRRIAIQWVREYAEKGKLYYTIYSTITYCLQSQFHRIYLEYRFLEKSFASVGIANWQKKSVTESDF